MGRKQHTRDRRSKQTMCDGKRKWESKGAAIKHSGWRRAKFGAHFEHVVAYKCNYCDGWHIGHRNR